MSAPLARWKDLCIDAADPSAAGRFWAQLLGGDLEIQGNGDAVVRRGRSEETVWINRVPEPKTVKHRVHLDVGVHAVEDVVAFGAEVVAPAEDTGFRWTVMRDPEGGELCAFVREDHASGEPVRLEEIVVDTADEASSRAIAGWWAEVLGGRAADDGRGFWWVEGVPDLPFDGFVFVPVPEPKTVKNRIHWDVECDDVAALTARGATVLRGPSESTPWHVCADPDGNEFCVFPRPAG